MAGTSTNKEAQVALHMIVFIYYSVGVLRFAGAHAEISAASRLPRWH